MVFESPAALVDSNKATDALSMDSGVLANDPSLKMCAQDCFCVFSSGGAPREIDDPAGC